MKLIRLHTAACDNALTRHDAGTELSIGDKPTQITTAKAKALVDAGGAIDATPAKQARAAIQPDHTSDEAE
jgi:hypothetical protein